MCRIRAGNTGCLHCAWSSAFSAPPLPRVQGTLFPQGPDRQTTSLPMVAARPAAGGFHRPLAAALRPRGPVSTACGVILRSLRRTTAIMVIRHARAPCETCGNELFAHMETLPIRYFDTHAHGDIMCHLHQRHRHPAPDDQPERCRSCSTPPSIVVSVFVRHARARACRSRPSPSAWSWWSLFAHQEARPALRPLLCRRSRRTSASVNGFIEEMMEGQKVVKVFCHEDKSRGGVRPAATRRSATAPTSANTYANLLDAHLRQHGQRQLRAAAP